MAQDLQDAAFLPAATACIVVRVLFDQVQARIDAGRALLVDPIIRQQLMAIHGKIAEDPTIPYPIPMEWVARASGVLPPLGEDETAA